MNFRPDPIQIAGGIMLHVNPPSERPSHQGATPYWLAVAVKGEGALQMTCSYPYQCPPGPFDLAGFLVWAQLQFADMEAKQKQPATAVDLGFFPPGSHTGWTGPPGNDEVSTIRVVGDGILQGELTPTAPPANAAPLRWTRDLPTVPGWYWVKVGLHPGFKSRGRVGIYRLFNDGLSPALGAECRLSIAFGDGGVASLVDDPALEYTLWAGPIPQPEEPR